jgi:hypothetical protein
MPHEEFWTGNRRKKGGRRNRREPARISAARRLEGFLLNFATLSRQISSSSLTKADLRAASMAAGDGNGEAVFDRAALYVLLSSRATKEIRTCRSLAEVVHPEWPSNKPQNIQSEDGAPSVAATVWGISTIFSAWSSSMGSLDASWTTSYRTTPRARPTRKDSSFLRSCSVA